MEERGNNMFSEKALEHAGRNNSTDTLPDASSGWRWIFLSALTLALCGLAYWGFCGTMVDSVPGVGIAMRSDGLGAIRSPGAGVIQQLNVKNGSVIAKDQVVGQVYNPDLFFKVKNMQADYDYLQVQINQLKEGQATLLQEKLLTFKEYKEKLDELVEKQVLSRERAEHIADIYARLLKSKTVTLLDHYAALERTLQNESSITSLVLQGAEYRQNQKDTLWEFKQKQLDMERQLHVKKLELELSQKLFSDNTWITSAEGGVVVELLKKAGDTVQPGSKIALVSSTTPSNIQVVAYISAKDGKKVRPGMSAYFAPSSFRPEEYGYIRGIVQQVGDYAGSAESVAAELENADFAQMISKEGPVVRVLIEFIPSQETVSGLQWTSKKGAGARLGPGTVGSVRINTEYRAPFSYVIPYLRHALLGVGENPEPARK